MSTATYPEIEPESGAGYTPQYHEFFGRLRRARIDKGLTLTEMAELVRLPLKSAYDFENLLMPLPFEWIEAWCKVVGVPFKDYIAVYWAMEEAYAAAQEPVETGALSSTDTHTSAPDPSHLPLRSAFDRIARFFRALFPKP